MEESRSRKTWELDRKALDSLLNLLGSQAAEASERYEKLRHRLIAFFRWERSGFPEQLADETLDRLAKRISEGAPVTGIDAFALGIARLVLLESQKKDARIRSALRAFPAAQPFQDRERAADSMERCLHALSRENQELILAYYTGEHGKRIENREGLANRLGISLNALRNRAMRIREGLEQCVRRSLDAGESDGE